VASGKKKDKFYFEKEHNVVWIKFKTTQKGNMGFNIIPRNIKDDYDFLIFKLSENEDISDIISKKTKPIRTNISRNKEENKSETGLSVAANSTHNVSGVQNEYSKSISVSKGETYYLVLDNVYDYGEGAVIIFNYMLSKQISGIVKDKENNPVVNGEITWEDYATGEKLAESKTDAEGKFNFAVPYYDNQNKKYILSANYANHFFQEQIYTAEDLTALKPINFVLTELKKGNKNSLHNINFVGNQAQLLPDAYSSLKRLTTLMKKNPTLKIMIEGHTNGCSGGFEFVQKLSEDRATTVKKYLIDNKIAENRIKTVGYNCSQMLYPNATNEKEQSLNRRVEILVTDL
jgi:outer membrane protein OmpA-like peptidoglycan-associated protein